MSGQQTAKTIDRGALKRWLKFSTVGAGGIVVQGAVLTCLVRVSGLHYLLATVLAVEAAIVHNFVWHLRWTWADRFNRSRQSRKQVVIRWLQFNVTTGAVTMLGNFLLMRALVGEYGLNVLAANLVAIALCSLLNFVISDRCIFA